MVRDTEGRRNKKKNKYKEKKKHPYKSGGNQRTQGINLKESQEEQENKEN